MGTFQVVRHVVACPAYRLVVEMACHQVVSQLPEEGKGRACPSAAGLRAYSGVGRGACRSEAFHLDLEACSAVGKAAYSWVLRNVSCEAWEVRAESRTSSTSHERWWHSRHSYNILALNFSPNTQQVSPGGGNPGIPPGGMPIGGPMPGIGPIGPPTKPPFRFA